MISTTQTDHEHMITKKQIKHGPVWVVSRLTIPPTLARRPPAGSHFWESLRPHTSFSPCRHCVCTPTRTPRPGASIFRFVFHLEWKPAIILGTSTWARQHMGLGGVHINQLPSVHITLSFIYFIWIHHSAPPTISKYTTDAPEPDADLYTAAVCGDLTLVVCGRRGQHLT